MRRAVSSVMAAPAHTQGCSCAERDRLFDEFRSANEELMRIHTEEIAILEENPSSVPSLNGQLAEARKRRDMAAEALRHHLLQHRC